MTELDSFLRQFGSGKGGRRRVLGIGTRQGAQKVVQGWGGWESRTTKSKFCPVHNLADGMGQGVNKH